MTITTEEHVLTTTEVNRVTGLVHLECRVGGDRHHWVQCQPDTNPEFGVPVVHQCAICNTIRRAIVAPRTGLILTRSYEYPEGYQAVRDPDYDPADGPLVRAAAVRMALIVQPRPLAELRPVRDG